MPSPSVSGQPLVAEGPAWFGQASSFGAADFDVESRQRKAAFDEILGLHVGATGVIEHTRLAADYVFIEGKVIGTVIARKALEITGSATLIGDASYDELIDMHPRARVRGKIEYRGDIDAVQN